MHIQNQKAYSNHLELTDQVLITDFSVDLYIFTPIYLHIFLYIFVHMSMLLPSGLKMLNCKQEFTINQYYLIKLNIIIKNINTKAVTATTQMHFAFFLINANYFYFSIFCVHLR